MCLPGGVSPGGYLPKGVYTSPPVDRMTDACENITFPQLLLRTVKIIQLCKSALGVPRFLNTFHVLHIGTFLNGYQPAGARSKNSATNHSTFQKTSELFSIGGGHVVPVVNNTTCFSIYKWLLFLLLFSSYFPLLSHSFLK